MGRWRPVDLTPEQIYLADQLLPLLTRDADIQESRVVKVIW